MIAAAAAGSGGSGGPAVRPRSCRPRRRQQHPRRVPSDPVLLVRYAIMMRSTSAGEGSNRPGATHTATPHHSPPTKRAAGGRPLRFLFDPTLPPTTVLLAAGKVFIFLSGGFCLRRRPISPWCLVGRSAPSNGCVCGSG
jgi:hypothetical protein